MARLQELLRQHPTFGYRRLWALLRYREGLQVNRKVVYRILKLKGWLVHQRPCTPRPRVRGWRSQTAASNQRWAMDVTHIPCGADGWAHLTTVIDCHDREVIGYEFALRGRLRTWLTWYNTGRPHQALGYRSPIQFRATQLVQVAS